MCSELRDSLNKIYVERGTSNLDNQRTYSVLKHGDLVRLSRYGELVGDDDHGLRPFSRERVAVVDALKHVVLSVRIEVRRRLVQEQEVRGARAHQGARDCDALPL